MTSDEGTLVPDPNGARPAEFFEYVGAALKALNALPRDKSYLALEIDNVPLISHGEVMGFLAINEADGMTFDFFPAKERDS